MQKLNSSLLEAAAYDSRSARLELRFRSGAVYGYFGVPPHTWYELLSTESAGRYFNSHIRNRFAYAALPSISNGEL